jgi:protein-tyrosine kinase
MFANALLRAGVRAPWPAEGTGSEINIVSRHNLTPCFRTRREFGPLVAGLSAAVGERGGTVLHLTATTPNEGVSFVARELAFAAAQAGMDGILLLDRSPDGAGLKTSLGLQSVPKIAVPGAGSSAMDVALCKMGDAFVHVARLGGDAVDRDGASGRGLLQGLYNRIREAFWLTIVDGPCVMDAPRFVYQSSLCDGVILVVGAEQARTLAVKQAKERLEDAGASLLGTILNRRRFYIPEQVYRWL